MACIKGEYRNKRFMTITNNSGKNYVSCHVIDRKGRGMCIVYHDPELERCGLAMLCNLFVIKKFRKHGLAKKLIRFSEFIVKDSGFHGIELWVKKHKKWLVKFYEKCGYICLNDEPDDKGLIAMYKTL